MSISNARSVERDATLPSEKHPSVSETRTSGDKGRPQRVPAPRRSLPLLRSTIPCPACIFFVYSHYYSTHSLLLVCLIKSIAFARRMRPSIPLTVLSAAAAYSIVAGLTELKPWGSRATAPGGPNGQPGADCLWTVPPNLQTNGFTPLDTRLSQDDTLHTANLGRQSCGATTASGSTGDLHHTVIHVPCREESQEMSALCQGRQDADLADDCASFCAKQRSDESPPKSSCVQRGLTAIRAASPLIFGALIGASQYPMFLGEGVNSKTSQLGMQERSDSNEPATTLEHEPMNTDSTKAPEQTEESLWGTHQALEEHSLSKRAKDPYYKELRSHEPIEGEARGEKWSTARDAFWSAASLSLGALAVAYVWDKSGPGWEPDVSPS